MIISFKMVDGSRYDVPATFAQKEVMIANLMTGNEDWYDVYEDERKQIILRASNIVSITIKGDADDGKRLS